MTERIQNLFAEKYVLDDREPVYTFTWADAEWGLYAPVWQLWQQMAVLLLLQVLFQCSVAAFNYYAIVQQRRTVAAYLIGWGLVVPIAVYAPYWVLAFLDIQSGVTKMATGSSAFIIGFRTIEAMYDTSPHSVEASLVNYVTYYTSLMHFDWDPKTATRRRISKHELLWELALLVFFLLLLSTVLSVELYYNFKPFDSPVVLDNYHLHLTDLLSPAHLGNAYGLALTVYLTLSFGFRLTALGEQLKGYRTQPIFHNPLFTSRSPSEFWGKRWNLTIHRILKHGAFLPARQFVTTNAAVLWTFVVSGLIHDYSWSLIFYQHEHTLNEQGECTDCFAPIFWKLTAFFAWNGCVMLLERPLGPIFNRYTRKWPTVIVSTLVVFTALPVSHWYSGDWAMGGYFHDLSIGVWQLRKISVS